VRHVLPPPASTSVAPVAAFSASAAAIRPRNPLPPRTPREPPPPSYARTLSRPLAAATLSCPRHCPLALQPQPPRAHHGTHDERAATAHATSLAPATAPRSPAPAPCAHDGRRPSMVGGISWPWPQCCLCEICGSHGPIPYLVIPLILTPPPPPRAPGSDPAPPTPCTSPRVPPPHRRSSSPAQRRSAMLRPARSPKRIASATLRRESIDLVTLGDFHSQLLQLASFLHWSHRSRSSSR
jgi:hypothetical protein